MFTAFSSKPKTVDSILTGFTQMLNDLGEVVRNTGAKIEDCTKRISEIEDEKSAAQIEKERAEGVSKRLAEIIGGTNGILASASTIAGVSEETTKPDLKLVS